jgi:hypothetical protein
MLRKSLRNASPTRPKRPLKSRQELQIPRRASPVPPEIFVRILDHSYFSAFRQAHLRNKRGYVYLCWREGKRVRNFYLGKARKPSPTRSADLDPPAPTSVSSPCRARK